MTQANVYLRRLSRCESAESDKRSLGGALDLIDGLMFAALLGDKAFDNNAIRDELEERGTEAVIPSKADRKQPIPYDRSKYRWRHLIENYFSKIKEFRAVNTRYDKTDLSYKATINLAAIAIALR